MNKLIFIALSLIFSTSGFAQVYVLKDHRPDTTPKVQKLYDNLPELCDSFFSQLKFEEVERITVFLPEKSYLKATFDTLDINYNEANLLVKHQNLQFNLQKQYKKMLKKAEKHKLKLKHLEKQSVNYAYGKDDKGNEFCYVSMICNKRKFEYEIKFVTIKLLEKWFIADELSMELVIK